jgi:hypothetical protein
MAPEVCPNCGAEVPPEAIVCPECGADDDTGWSEFADAQRLDLPDQDFDYQEFVSRELEGNAPERRGPQTLWWLVAGVLLILLILFLILWSVG